MVILMLLTLGIIITKAKNQNHTELMLKYLKYPIEIKNKSFDLIKIKGLSQFSSFEYKIPGDTSLALFLLY